MGEARTDALRLDFDHSLRLEFHGTKVTSDAGLPASLDEGHFGEFSKFEHMF